MANALIGYTGFVGSNLDSQRVFDAKFNSRNFQEMRGQSFDTVIAAGVSAVKWKANKEPEADKAGIAALESVLSTVTARQFVLISTIDVYAVPSGKDESFDCHSLPNHAYGSHRLAHEDFCRSHFQNCCVIRLPGLFGPGLKKNVIFDLLNDNCLEMINPGSSFQYYNLENLASDIDRALAFNLPLVNLFTEPVPTRSILEHFFPKKQVGQKAVPEAHYNLMTRHANLWGSALPYIASAPQVMKQIESFVSRANALRANS